MKKMIYCRYLKCNAVALEYPPYPGEIGVRVLEGISEAGWEQWMKHQTMLINEGRCNVMDPKTRHYLEQAMVSFLFGSE